MPAAVEMSSQTARTARSPLRIRKGLFLRRPTTLATIAYKLDVLINMRKMVMAGEPANPLVNPSYDPVDRNWLIFSIRVPWIRERSRMEKAASRLLAQRDARQGRRAVATRIP